MKSITNYNPLELPSRYRRRNIAQQIAYQRKLFDPIWKSNIESKKTKLASHIPGLINIMEESIAISYDFFIDNPEYDPKLDKVTKALKTIWDIAVELDRKQKYTMNFSIYIHKILAATIDAFRANNAFINESISEPDIPVNEDNVEEMINHMVKNYINYGGFYNELIIFLLHRHPNKNIKNSHVSHKTFVDQFFHQDYSANIILFDVISGANERLHSKEEPHWGTQNSVYKMLKHDTNHCMNIGNSLFSRYELQYILKLVYDAIQHFQSLNKDNSVEILYNGLFLLFHEILSDPKFSVSNQSYFKIYGYLKECKLIDAIQLLTQEVKMHSINAIVGNTLHNSKLGDFNYKFLLRDREFVLKNAIDLNGNSFLPMISVSANKIRPFPIGQRENGPLFIVENPEVDINYILSSTAIPEDLKQQRREKMTVALQDGYKRFWDDFSYLVDEYYNINSSQEDFDRTYSSNACVIL